MLHMIKKAVFILLVFIVVTGFWIYIKSDASLGSPKGIIDFTRAYFVWFSNAFGNAKDVSGYISKQDWKNEIQNKTD